MSMQESVQSKVAITLADGSSRALQAGITPFAIAESISASLAKDAIAARVNDRLVDLSFPILEDSQLTLITDKNPEGLEVLRHSTAHLLAHAVKQLFPSAQMAIGPVIENGFYYDFTFERSFTPEDLEKIEARMHELARAAHRVERRELSRKEAIALFNDRQEQYKVKMLQELGDDQIISVYQQAEFIDLCRGPHVPNTSKLNAFKLTKVAGAYWRGDHRNEMLQRIYGTAFASKKALEEYLHRLEEAEKRDHRKLAHKMDLFHFQEEAPGMVFWHPNGWSLYQAIRDYIRQQQQQAGYDEINTPMLVDESLWHQSGHMAKFNDDMFMTQSEARNYVVKPMSCPCHIQVFKQGVKSYRDLPLRYSEFGCCHRNEPSGALHGLMRLRNFVQDDGHIFCTEEQVRAEAKAFTQQLYKIYDRFGFKDILVKLSTRPEKRVGDDAVWDKAEQTLQEVLESAGVTWTLQPGEGAFYGPKLEYALRDCLGRVWQCGTFQLDFFLPERLGAYYVAEDNTRRHPVMLHRATLGSIERFVGILLEEYGGNLPAWLAPIQVAVLNISEAQAEYCHSLADVLKKHGVRVKLDLRNEKISYKIREHTISRVPYLLIIGDKECEAKTITVRTQSGEQRQDINILEFVKELELV